MSVTVPNTYNFCNSSDGQKPTLQLFDDKCFKITDGEQTSGSFCLPDFAFPADGFNMISKEISFSGDSSCQDRYVLFNNNIEVTSPSDELDENCEYARGLMLKINYSLEDINGEELQLKDKNAIISITSATGETCEYPLYNMFVIFNNPASTDPLDLINKIEVINPSENYKFKIEGIVIYTKASNG